jgi:hypothetical protein
MASILKTKGRCETGRFVNLPHIVINTQDYIGLSYKSKALLVDIIHQYNGKNNGDLTVAHSILRKRGWKREATIWSAVKELLAVNLIIRTREGQFRNPHSRCALYAITWQRIDDCHGKDLDLNPSITPPRKFSLEKS